MSDMRLVVTGAAGRMGRTLVKTLHETPGVTLVGALERPGSAALGQDAGVLAGLPPLGVALTDDPLPLLMEADGIIDFSAPLATVEMAALAAQARIAHIVGTTGLSEADGAKLVAAARHAPIVRSGNMSLGVNLLAGLVRLAAEALGEEFDIEIVEMHHRNKVDAPSGTALMLGEAAATGARDRIAGSFRARPRRADRRAQTRRHRLRFATRRRRDRRPQRHLRRRRRADHAIAPSRGSGFVRARRPKGGAVGARAEAGALRHERRVGTLTEAPP